MSDVPTTESPVTVTDDLARTEGARLLKLAVDYILNRDQTNEDGSPLVSAEDWAALSVDAATTADLLDKPFVCTHGRTPPAPKHEETCNTVREHDVSRSDAEAARDLELETVPEKYRELVAADLNAKIAAEYDCNCAVSRKAARASGPRGERKATIKMSTYIIDGAGVKITDTASKGEGPFRLRIVFAEPSTAERNFDLPYDRKDAATNKAVKQAATKWASENGATEGQVNAVIKAMTDNGWKSKAA